MRAYYFGSNCPKNLFFCMIQGSYVPNFVQIGPQITSQSCPRSPDGTDGRWRDFILCRMTIKNHRSLYLPQVSRRCREQTYQDWRRRELDVRWSQTGDELLTTRQSEATGSGGPRCLDARGMQQSHAESVHTASLLTVSTTTKVKVKFGYIIVRSKA